MRNRDGHPYAYKAMDDIGFWVIYFDPFLRLDGFYHYSQLTGPIDEGEAQMVVDALLAKAQKQCQCGGIIFADTEDWPVPVCYDCHDKIAKDFE